MEFNNIYAESFVKYFKKLNKTKEKQDNKQLNKIIFNNLLSDLNESYKKVYANNCFKGYIRKLDNVNQVKKPNNNVYNSHFFPKEIRDYIDNNASHYIDYECIISGHKIKVIITYFKAQEQTIQSFEKTNELIAKIYSWLEICIKYSQKKMHCAEDLTIYIYKSPFLKELPQVKGDIILGPEHVNTAFTTNCSKKGEIVIYREEEWFKVFIHETFHAFGLDFGGYDNSHINKEIIKLFPINSKFNLFEAYSEFWARLINCAYVAYEGLENKKDKKTFALYMEFCLELEKFFSIYQCNKVLNYMNLDYNNLIRKDNRSILLRKNNYKEATNVFAYYVLTTIFLNNYSEFLLWCKENNESNLYCFALQDSNIIDNNKLNYKYNKLIDFIKNNMHSIEFDNLLFIKEINNDKIKKTTRMSLLG